MWKSRQKRTTKDSDGDHESPQVCSSAASSHTGRVLEHVTIKLITPLKTVHIWAHLHQRAGLLIPACGDMIKARIKSKPVIQSVWRPACIISSNASLSLYCTGQAQLSRCSKLPLQSYISVMQGHEIHYESQSINILWSTLCPKRIFHILAQLMKQCSSDDVFKLPRCTDFSIILLMCYSRWLLCMKIRLMVQRCTIFCGVSCL